MADPEPDWDALRAELGDKAAMLLAHTLVHYIDQGHPLEIQMRSANAISWIDHGQYVMLVRLDQSSEFWRIRDQLAEERQPRT